MPLVFELKVFWPLGIRGCEPHNFVLVHKNDFIVGAYQIFVLNERLLIPSCIAFSTMKIQVQDEESIYEHNDV